MPKAKIARRTSEKRRVISEDYRGADLEIFSEIEKLQNPKIKIKQYDWTEKQKALYKIALNDETRIVFIKGPAGTSKTLCATYCGLQKMNSQKIEKIAYIRSAVESASTKLLALPGSFQEKMAPYMAPFIDKIEDLVEDSSFKRLEERGKVEVATISYARGTEWKNKFVIIDESQNITFSEMTTLLTRIGKGSVCFVLGDPMQTDIRRVGDFARVYDLFNNEESRERGIHAFEFTEEDIMRDELVKYIVGTLKKF